jgi:hypothetical protein
MPCSPRLPFAHYPVRSEELECCIDLTLPLPIIPLDQENSCAAWTSQPLCPLSRSLRKVRVLHVPRIPFAYYPVHSGELECCVDLAFPFSTIPFTQEDVDKSFLESSCSDPNEILTKKERDKFYLPTGIVGKRA